MCSSPRYLPRKGTETNLLLLSSKWQKQRRLRHDIYPARGRKPNSRYCLPSIKVLASPRYLPRKGTETRSRVAIIANNFVLRHDIYPARGRKRQRGEYWREMLRTSPRYLPRKGTETSIPKNTIPQHENFSFATIFTPQGDGN